MANIALITTVLKGFTAFWSLLVLAVSAGLIGRYNADVSRFRVYGSGFNQGNAVLAASIFDLAYFVTAVVFLFIRPTSILISVMVDTVIMGFLFLLTLGSVAALSDVAAAFRGCNGTSFCSLGNATLGLGWILVFLILGILLLEVIVTLRAYGRDMDTWRTPFNELVTNGTSSRTGGVGGGVSGGGIGGGASMSGVGGGPQVVHRV